MGRKKIEIKLIKNERLRNITYNKRKRGLLKKLVELSIMCGIKAKLEMRDSFGNHIVLDAGRRADAEDEEDKDKVFVFTPADYPEFKGFERIKRRSPVNQPDELSVSEEANQEQKLISQKQQEIVELKPKLEHVLQNPIPIRKPVELQESAFKRSPPILTPPLTVEVDYLKQLQNLQAMRLQSQLEYAAMSYQNLFNTFMSSQKPS